MSTTAWNAELLPRFDGRGWPDWTPAQLMKRWDDSVAQQLGLEILAEWEPEIETLRHSLCNWERAVLRQLGHVAMILNSTAPIAVRERQKYGLPMQVAKTCCARLEDDEGLDLDDDRWEDFSPARLVDRWGAIAAHRHELFELQSWSGDPAGVVSQLDDDERNVLAMLGYLADLLAADPGFPAAEQRWCELHECYTTQERSSPHDEETPGHLVHEIAKIEVKVGAWMNHIEWE